MKDEYTYEVGDSIHFECEPLGFNVLNASWIYLQQDADVIYVDLYFAIVHLRCQNKFEQDQYDSDGINWNEFQRLEPDFVRKCIGPDFTCGEYDIFLDAYHGKKINPSNKVPIYDENGNSLDYYDVKEPEYIAYCSLQALDQIRYIKIFGVPSPGYAIRALSSQELAELNLSEEGNYYKASIMLLKEFNVGDFANLSIYDDSISDEDCPNYSIDGEIVYSHDNIAVVETYCFIDQKINRVDFLSRIEFDDLVKLPGADYLNDVSHDELVSFWAFDQITGETEEQLKYFEVPSKNGDLFHGTIVGYRYSGRKIIGRYIRLFEDEQALEEFSDRQHDNFFMCTGRMINPDFDKGIFYFEVKEGEVIKAIH